MLKIKTIVKTSTIPNSGNGLFANQDIQKNTIIWQLNPVVDKVLSTHDYKMLDDIEKEFLDTYAYRVGNTLILCSDNGKYINHSENPNVDDLIDPIYGSITIANRDILCGEELLSNYKTFDDDSKNDINFK